MEYRLSVVETWIYGGYCVLHTYLSSFGGKVDKLRLEFIGIYMIHRSNGRGDLTNFHAAKGLKY